MIEDVTALAGDLCKLTTELRDWVEARDPSGDEENSPDVRDLLDTIEDAEQTLNSLCYDTDLGGGR